MKMGNYFNCLNNIKNNNVALLSYNNSSAQLNY